MHVVLVGVGDALDGGFQRARAIHHLKQAAEQQDGERDGNRAAYRAAAQHARDGRHEDVPQALRVGLHGVVRARNGIAAFGQIVRAARNNPGQKRNQSDDGEQYHVRVRHLELFLLVLFRFHFFSHGSPLLSWVAKPSLMPCDRRTEWMNRIGGRAQPSPKAESPLGCYETQVHPSPETRENGRPPPPRQGRAPAARPAGFGGIPASYTRGMYRLPSVAAMMALMVCMRFSACSNWRPRSQ